MLLIKFETNWADEMDIYGFCIMTAEEWEYKKKEIKHCSFPEEVYFGTNEYNIYETPEEFLNEFKETEITDFEVQLIDKLFTNDYGRFPLMEGSASEEFYEEYGDCPE